MVNNWLARTLTGSILGVMFLFGSVFGTHAALAQSDEVRGLYRGYLLHEDTNFFQYAAATLRTVNQGGQLKIAASLKVYFGDWNSQEYLTYEYPEVPLNILTRQINMKADNADVSALGTLKSGVIEGEWFSTINGRIGTFKLEKGTNPPNPPANTTLVRSLSGYYRGTLTNTNPQSNLPERITMSFVTTQDSSDGTPRVVISGNSRFYLGPFDSNEYEETVLESIQFNFYTRFLSARSQEYRLTFKGTMSPDGKFQGNIYSDALGEVGRVELNRFP